MFSVFNLKILGFVSVGLALLITAVVIIGIVFSLAFQKKQRKKQEVVEQLMKEKEGKTINSVMNKNYSATAKSKDNIELMQKLYDSYIEYQTRFNELDKSYDNFVTPTLKEYSDQKIDLLKSRNSKEVREKIELINYTIVEKREKSLKFRLTINCVEYAMRNDNITRGSNINKMEEILLLTCRKVEEDWVVDRVDKIYENRL